MARAANPALKRWARLSRSLRDGRFRRDDASSLMPCFFAIVILCQVFGARSKRVSEGESQDIPHLRFAITRR